MESKKYIDDVTSIKLVIKKLEKIQKSITDIERIVTEYYGEKNIEVLSIYEKIVEFDKK